MKYYGTIINGLIIPEEVAINLGIERNRHSQYRLVIKAKSRAAANRRWTEVTGKETIAFSPKYTSITGNETELKLCDQYGEIIGSTSANRFIALSVLIDEIERNKNN